MASRSHTTNTGFWWSVSVFYLWSRSIGDNTWPCSTRTQSWYSSLSSPVTATICLLHIQHLQEFGPGRSGTPGKLRWWLWQDLKSETAGVVYGVRRRNHWFLGICKHSQGFELSWVENLRRTNFVCIIHFTSVTPAHCQTWKNHFFVNSEILGMQIWWEKNM